MNYKKILIAVDNSPVAEKVAREGYQIGVQLNAEIALVSIIDTAIIMTDSSANAEQMAAVMTADLKNTQTQLTQKIFKDRKAETFIEEGTPYETVLAVAQRWHADLLVIGTHGRTGLSHVVMGSVAEKIIRHSVLPVLVVPVKQR